MVFDNNCSCLWLIILLLLVFCCGGSNMGCANSGMNCSCGGHSHHHGCGDDCCTC